MRKYGILIWICLLIAGALNAQPNGGDDEKFRELIAAFCHPAEDTVLLSNDRRLFVSAMTDLQNARYHNSRTKMEELLLRSEDTTLLTLMSESYGNLLLMQKDWKTLHTFLAGLKESEKGSEDMHTVVLAFSQMPPETIVFSKDSSWISVKRKFGSKNPFITVNIGKKTVRGVFDTGAGITVVSESFARRHGIVLSENVSATATSASDKQLSCKPAFIPMLQIGNVLVRNHPVGVMADEQLEFRFLGLRLVKFDLIVGWPLIQELAVEIRYKENKMLISDPEKSIENRRNLFWYNTPMVKVQEAGTGRPLYFELDLGGQESNIYEDIFEQLSDTAGTRAGEAEFGGAGGFTSYRSYTLPLLKVQLQEQELEFKNIRTRPKSGIYKNLRPAGVFGGSIASDRVVYLNARKGQFELR